MNNPFPEHMNQGGPRSVMSSDQGLSPPYSNQSPPYSVQSNMALSPQGYLSMKKNAFKIMFIIINLFTN